MIYPTVYGILRNREEAEDVLQESILRGFEKLGDLRDTQNYPSWQKQIALRLALNRLRGKKSLVTFVDEDAAVEMDNLGDDEEITDIDLAIQCLEELPEGYRLSIRLHLLDGLTHEEIGDALGIEASTARSQYSRALKKLKNKIRIIHAGQI